MRKIYLLLFSFCFTISGCLEVPKIIQQNTPGIIEISVNDYYKEYLENDITIYFLNNNEKMTGNYHIIDNNLLIESMSLSNGLLFDANKIYFPNGKVSQETMYRRGVKIGDEKFYYPTGELKKKQKYSNNIKSGKPIYYEKDGTLTVEKEYIDGKIYKGGVLIGEEYQYNHKEKGILNVIKIYERDGSNKLKLIVAYPEDENEFIIFLLDKKHTIIETINPEKNPEKFQMLTQKMGEEFME